jgi:membrane associated rhomboid family serine protease
MTPVVKRLVIANTVVFAAQFFSFAFLQSDWLVSAFGLSPRAVLSEFQIWRLATYLFLHDPGGFTHVLFNMLALWMFGVDLERRWGSIGFLKYYAVTGIGAGLVTVVVSLLPFAATRGIFEGVTIGASGAIYGLLLAWAVLFPARQILFMFVFPLSARIAALLMGAMAFLGAVSGRNGAVAEATHVAGFVIGWLYLKGHSRLVLDVKYRIAKWRMARLRRRFDVHRGGKNDRIH